MAIRIYVGNLPYTFREEDIAQLFAPYGEVYEIRLITDRDTRQSKGFGFVELASDEEARRAIGELNGTPVGNRTLTVNEARPQTERTNRRDYR
jgi:RNA recognition motif-containing protein